MTALTAQHTTAAVQPTGDLRGEDRIHNAVSAAIETTLRRNEISPAAVVHGLRNALVEALYHIPEAERGAAIDQIQTVLSRLAPSSDPTVAPARK